MEYEKKIFQIKGILREEKNVKITKKKLTTLT